MGKQAFKKTVQLKKAYHYHSEEAAEARHALSDLKCVAKESDAAHRAAVKEAKRIALVQAQAQAQAQAQDQHQTLETW
jgi:hypothetical protein